jgi:hypothetical protein
MHQSSMQLAILLMRNRLSQSWHALLACLAHLYAICNISFGIVRPDCMSPKRSHIANTDIGGRMRKAYLVIGALSGCAISACSSLSSTYVGESKSGVKYEGMPVVLQRPKYLKVTYKKVTYRVFADRTETQGSTAVAKVEPVGDAQTVDEVTTEVMSVGEVYTLDLKRPAAGKTEYAAEFEANSYYPKKVGAKIEDKTIEVASSALGETLKAVAGLPGFKAAAAAPEAKTQVVRIAEQTVRIQLCSLDNLKTCYQLFPEQQP